MKKAYYKHMPEYTDEPIQEAIEASLSDTGKAQKEINETQEMLTHYWEARQHCGDSSVKMPLHMNIHNYDFSYQDGKSTECWDVKHPDIKECTIWISRFGETGGIGFSLRVKMLAQTENFNLILEKEVLPLRVVNRPNAGPHFTCQKRRLAYLTDFIMTLDDKLFEHRSGVKVEDLKEAIVRMKITSTTISNSNRK